MNNVKQLNIEKNEKKKNFNLKSNEKKYELT